MNEKQQYEMIITVAERAGIELDVPEMNGFFEMIEEFGWQEQIDRLVSTVIHHTAAYLSPMDEVFEWHDLTQEELDDLNGSQS